MRCLFLILFATPFCNAQDSLYGTKWYLNAAEISNFGENDTSVIMTTVSNDSFLFFGEKLAFGTEQQSNEPIPSYYYLFFNNGSSHVDLAYYKTKKEFRKKQNAQYLEIYFEGSEMAIIDYPYSLEPFNNYAYERRLIYSKTKDSLQFTSKILGSWSCDSTINLIYGKNTDTLIFNKVVNAANDKDCIYTFKRLYGSLYCISKCSDITYCTDAKTFKNHGYPPDPYYVSHGSGNECSIDLANQQLVFNYRGVSYTIIELTENEMKLVCKTN